MGRLVPEDFDVAAVRNEAERRVIAVAVGEAKLPALSAALRGRLVNGLVTNEVMAERLLAAR